MLYPPCCPLAYIPLAQRSGLRPITLHEAPPHSLPSQLRQAMIHMRDYLRFLGLLLSVFFFLSYICNLNVTISRINKPKPICHLAPCVRQKHFIIMCRNLCIQHKGHCCPGGLQSRSPNYAEITPFKKVVKFHTGQGSRLFILYL